MSEWADKIQAQINELRAGMEAAIEGVRSAQVKRDEQMLKTLVKTAKKRTITVQESENAGAAAAAQSAAVVTAEAYTDAAVAGLSVKFPVSVVTTTFSPASNTITVAKTSGTPYTGTLPASPAANDQIWIKRSGGDVVTIAPGGVTKIDNSVSSITLAADGDGVILVYHGGDSWWTFRTKA